MQGLEQGDELGGGDDRVMLAALILQSRRTEPELANDAFMREVRDVLQGAVRFVMFALDERGGQIGYKFRFHDRVQRHAGYMALALAGSG